MWWLNVNHYSEAQNISVDSIQSVYRPSKSLNMTIKINLDNAAFEDYGSPEVSRILDRIGKDLEGAGFQIGEG